MGPKVTQEIWITLSDHPLIRGNDHPGRRIEAVRQFVERNKSRPFAVSGSAVVRHAAVTGLANRDAPRAVVTDVPVNISLDGQATVDTVDRIANWNQFKFQVP